MDVIRGALPISGTYLFGPKSGLSMNPRFLGDREEGQETDASPLTYVRAGAPPFHVAWGENDFLHLCAQGTKFVEALRSVGNSISTQTLIDVDHLGASYASADPEGEWVVAADEFISRM
jgi:arylformamidase